MGDMLDYVSELRERNRVLERPDDLLQHRRLLACTLVNDGLDVLNV